MRLVSLVLAGAFIAIPAMAQSVQNFGSYTCSQRVACPDDADAATSEVYVAAGNACMKAGLGYSSPAGYFDSSGLNGSQCLTAIPGAFPKGLGAQLTPNCCVVKIGSACVFHCDLNTYQ